MALERNGTVLNNIRTLFNVGMTAGLTDGQLLEQFATRRGEASELAFAVIVERHGPMVLRACRGIVQDEHDAQDAFQATFLILVRRVGALWVRDSLGPWLHRVACRVATRARLGTDRRSAAERRAAEAARNRGGGPAPDDQWRVIQEEIDRLPDHYRIPILLCDVENRTYEETARHLGCPIGTVKSRLARGRERLRERLARRGLSPASGLVGVGLLAEPAKAMVPVVLIENTCRAAVWTVTAKGTGGPVSTSVVALVNGVSRTMAMTNLCKVPSAGLVLGVVAIGGGGLIPTGSHPLAIANGVTGTSRTDDPQCDWDKLQGTWVRISTDGVKADKTVKMMVEPAKDRPEGDLPVGALTLNFTWKTDGTAGGSHNRVLLDPTRNPKALDFLADEEGAPKVCPGIYKLEGDVLTVCFRATQGRRPNEFVTVRRGETLDVYRRVKP
ncbi:RNA polymerase sigma-70 factor, ECF subfamily [Singulisphaera sp. GP187]|uniref:sigma-70 family RNA polymerase sigma factor n=1 Tax=Singulisphaera sp. GP187 TaxID=1882752 RepID=UPI00092676EB|nr:sigma-70 family RNA polymerase sigma factor [Singulisphaera sp. GP187]SIO60900.1 RNA polymerase sigma-70 factor, ECF subfamily [Singulisphaera sp. GP187]